MLDQSVNQLIAYLIIGINIFSKHGRWNEEPNFLTSLSPPIAPSCSLYHLGQLLHCCFRSVKLWGIESKKMITLTTLRYRKNGNTQLVSMIIFYIFAADPEFDIFFSPSLLDLAVQEVGSIFAFLQKIEKKLSKGALSLYFGCFYVFLDKELKKTSE